MPQFNPAIFREYDIRGIAGKDLSAALARKLGLAYSHFIRKETGNNGALTVSVGRDCRLTSDEYADALIDGLRSGGLNVVSIGVCPTPLTYFSVFHLNLDGAIMITGSHNAAEYNGFKIGVGKGTLHGHQIQELKVLIESDLKESDTKGSYSEHPIIPDYIEYVVKNSVKSPKKKVVIDAGNATAGTVAPRVFELLGAEVIPLYCDLDGRFPNHHPDPTVLENLEDLIATVKKEGADFGIAFDGDSDRGGVVDENGRPIFGDELMVILSRAVLKTSPGATIISEVKSSNRLYDDIAKHGGKPLMWKTGHSLIKAKMKETGAALAGEMSGHIFFADRYFGYDDGIYSALRFYEIAGAAKGPVSSLLEGLPPAVATPEIRVDCDEAKKFALVEATKAILSATYPKINDIDGVRVDFGNAWGLVRASNTQPVLVLRFEAESAARLDEVRSIVTHAIREAAKKIGHPPVV